MKQLFFLFFLVSSTIYAQDFARVDKLVESYPRYASPDQLAQKIARDFRKDDQKVRAIFKWLTNNIRYDVEAYYQPKRSIQFSYGSEEERLRKIQAIKDNIVREAFLTKKGVCEEYAQSFKKVADLLGIESEVVKGYTRNSAYEIGRVPSTTNHAWNAVKVNNRWVILDATWASGYLFNGRWVKNFNDYFFRIPSKKIGKTHFPEDRKWQILLDSRNIKRFYNQPIYSQSFLNTDLEILSPKEGVIRLNRSQKIVLKIKNFTASQKLYYNYRGQRYSQRPTITFQGGIATITIENPGGNTELYLFLNKRLAIEYKVLVN